MDGPNTDITLKDFRYLAGTAVGAVASAPTAVDPEETHSSALARPTGRCGDVGQNVEQSFVAETR